MNRMNMRFFSSVGGTAGVLGGSSLSLTGMASISRRKRKDGTTGYNVFWKEPGHRNQSNRTFDTESEALTLKNFLDANNTFSLAARAARDLRSTAPTVAEIVAESINLLTGIEPGTVSKYRSIARIHIQDSSIGHVPVDRLDRGRVIAWFNDIDRAAKTKRNIQAVLSSGLKHAMRRKLISENVAEGIKPPRSSLRKREPVFLTDEQVRLLRRGLPSHYRLLLDFLLGTGLRYSEAAALTPQAFRVTAAGRLVVVPREVVNAG